MNNSTISALIDILIGDLSHIQFAKKAGVKPMNITRWKNGTKIPLVEFEKLCKASGRTMSETLQFVEGIEETYKYKYDINEGSALLIHNLIEEVNKLEELNKGETGSLIVHITEHVKQLRALIENIENTR